MQSINGKTAPGGGLLLPYEGKWPRVAEDAFIAPGAVLIGDVEIGPRASVWYNCVLRGDVNRIVVGEGSNIQDGSVVHCDREFPTIIEKGVLVGHMVMVHGTVMEEGSFAGIKACLLDGCHVEAGGMVAAGAIVPPGRRILKGQLWAGVPAKHIRDLKPEEVFNLTDAPRRYEAYARRHRDAVFKTD